MKIIFLDIDGVLNGFETLNDPTTTDLKPDSLEFWAYYIDEDKVKRLNQIIDETDAMVVLSTSWRLHLTQKFITEVLELKGFGGYIVGATIEMPLNSRADEIDCWVFRTRPEKYIIIDDDFISNNKQVRTDGRYGLQDKHVEQAICYLNG